MCVGAGLVVVAAVAAQRDMVVSSSNFVAP